MAIHHKNLEAVLKCFQGILRMIYFPDGGGRCFLGLLYPVVNGAFTDIKSKDLLIKGFDAVNDLVFHLLLGRSRVAAG